MPHKLSSGEFTIKTKVLSEEMLPVHYEQDQRLGKRLSAKHQKRYSRFLLWNGRRPTALPLGQIESGVVLAQNNLCDVEEMVEFALRYSPCNRE